MFFNCIDVYNLLPKDFFFCLLKKEAVLYASQYDLDVTTNLSLEKELTAAVLSSF